MHVLTCISDLAHPGYRTFLEGSCRHFGLALTTLVHDGAWTSHRLKDGHLLDHLRRLPDDETVLFTDGYDTMFLCSEDEILEKYRSFGKPVVFTAEKNCWPDASLAGLYPESPTRFRFLNSGGFVGKAGAIAGLLAARLDADSRFGWSNQYRWTRIFLEHREMIALDYQAEIFLDLSTPMSVLPAGLAQFQSRAEGSELYAEEWTRLSGELGLTGPRVISTTTGTVPCQVHFNGPVVKRVVENGLLSPVMAWRA